MPTDAEREAEIRERHHDDPEHMVSCDHCLLLRLLDSERVHANQTRNDLGMTVSSLRAALAEAGGVIENAQASLSRMLNRDAGNPDVELRALSKARAWRKKYGEGT